VLARHIWGLDLSKTLQDGGGVGGLLGTVGAERFLIFFDLKFS
jgi:hypothetical protein